MHASKYLRDNFPGVYNKSSISFGELIDAMEGYKGDTKEPDSNVVNPLLDEVPKCEAERHIIGNVTIQRLNHDRFWYAVYKNQIIDRDRYQSDLEERVRHLV